LLDMQEVTGSSPVSPTIHTHEHQETALTAVLRYPVLGLEAGEYSLRLHSVHAELRDCPTGPAHRREERHLLGS
jgi:hypothetical protein